MVAIFLLQSMCLCTPNWKPFCEAAFVHTTVFKLMLLASVFMCRVTSAVEVTCSMCYGCRDVTVHHVKYLSLLELLRVHVLLLGKNMVPSWSLKMSTSRHLQTFPFIPAASCPPASPLYCNSSSYPPGSGLMPQSVTRLGSHGQMISRWSWGFFVV